MDALALRLPEVRVTEDTLGDAGQGGRGGVCIPSVIVTVPLYLSLDPRRRSSPIPISSSCFFRLGVALTGPWVPHRTLLVPLVVHFSENNFSRHYFQLN